MFKIGDIVRPKKGFIGHDCCFKVIESEINPFDDNLYKLQRIEQSLDSTKSPLNLQLRTIRNVETTFWREKELELTSDVKLHYGGTVTNIDDITTTSFNFDKFTKELIKSCEIKIDKINKEENEMQILDIYKERKNELLMNNFYKEKQEIMKEDEIQKIKDEMINQINIILDNEGSNEKFETLVPGLSKIITTKQTEEKLNKIEMELDSEKDKLYNTIQEVKALFELTDDYEERIKILKNYKILNKDGKLSI